jgi:TetR/AcrR family transcriptional regulator, regulator of cefoperazone and chloramphenicol sensitivity
MTTSPNSSARMETRQRLLEAAGEVFAEQGFRNTTIREICRRAQANLAAVNYHFGDKEGLYAAVMKYAYACALEKYPLAQRESEEMPAGDRLHAFIRYLLLSIFEKGPPAWLGKIMAREMIEPTRALDDLVESIIYPMGQKLGAIVRALLGEQAPDDLVHRCQMSIIGQCLHYRNARPVIQRLFPEHQYSPEDIAAMADHITRFSLGGLRGLTRPEGDGSTMLGDKGLPQ